jgi:hypothetical protein
MRKKVITIVFLSLLILMIFSISREGYVYRYEREDSGFMSYSQMGEGIVCPGIFGAYYQIDYDWNEEFLRFYQPSKEELKKLNDPHIIAEELRENLKSETLELGNRTVIVELAWDENGTYLITHHRIRTVYKEGILVEVTKSITHRLNYNPNNSTVIVDYVDTHITYTIEKTRCWVLLISWSKSQLRKYLKEKLGKIPYPRPYDSEPW